MILFRKIFEKARARILQASKYVHSSFLPPVGETKECLGAAVLGRVSAGSAAAEREDECGGAAGENEKAPESFSA